MHSYVHAHAHAHAHASTCGCIFGHCTLPTFLLAYVLLTCCVVLWCSGYAAEGYHRTLLDLIVAVPQSAKSAWNDLHIMACVPQACQVRLAAA